MALKKLGNKVEQWTLLTVNLLAQTILAQEGNLHSREESRQEQHNAYDYYGVYQICRFHHP
jgi:hypothetical protein